MLTSTIVHKAGFRSLDLVVLGSLQHAAAVYAVDLRSARAGGATN